jgi:hypothetical protein
MEADGAIGGLGLLYCTILCCTILHYTTTLQYNIEYYIIHWLQLLGF